MRAFCSDYGRSADRVTWRMIRLVGAANQHMIHNNPAFTAVHADAPFG